MPYLENYNNLSTHIWRQDLQHLDMCIFGMGLARLLIVPLKIFFVPKISYFFGS